MSEQKYTVMTIMLVMGFVLILLGTAMAMWRPQKEFTPLALIGLGFILIIGVGEEVAANG